MVLYAIYFLLPAYSLLDEVSHQRGPLFFEQAPQSFAQAKQDGPWTKYAAQEQMTDGGRAASTGGLQALPQERKLMPWEKKWDNAPQVVYKFSFLKLAIVFIGIPLLVWLFVEMFVLVIRWVVVGFRADKINRDALKESR